MWESFIQLISDRLEEIVLAPELTLQELNEYINMNRSPGKHLLIRFFNPLEE